MRDRKSKEQVQLCLRLHYFEWIKAASRDGNTAQERFFLSASDPGFTLKSYEKTKITRGRVNTVYEAVWRNFTNILLTKQDDLYYKTPSLHQAWN